MVLWIFGYGSLIWTPEFQYEERVTGYVKDFTRVFVPAGSGDNDGTGATRKAGLGLTLDQRDGAITRGVAYRVTGDVEHQIVSSYLKDSHATMDASRALMLDFFTSEASDTPAISGVMTYIAPPETSSLWYVVLQPLPPRGTVNQSERVPSAGSQMMISGKNAQTFASRRVSRRDRYRDGVWFESQHSRVSN